MKRFKEIVWGRIYLWIFRPFYTLENTSLFWHLVNHGAVRHWKQYGTKEPSGVTKRVCTELEDAGIAITSLDELYGDSEQTLATLRAWKDTLPNKPHRFKPFITDYMDIMPVITLANPLAALVLDDRTLAIAGTYLGMSPKLQEFSLGEIRVLPEGTPKISSMRWHRDPHDRRLLKMFIYLTDVALENGPFSYIRYSSRGGTYANLFPQKPPAGFYPPAGEIEKRVNPADIQVCTGPAGTVIFADTAGLHGGGYVLKDRRLMSTAGFLPMKSFTMRFPHYAGEPSALSPLQREALLGDEHLFSREVFKTVKRTFLGKESFGDHGTYL